VDKLGGVAVLAAVFGQMGEIRETRNLPAIHVIPQFGDKTPNGT
jgi:hypothetical protein